MTPDSHAPAGTLQRSTFLTRADATKLLVDAGVPLSATTLDYWATTGQGPKFRIINGRAVYRRSDLESWLDRDDRATGAA